MSAVVVDKVHKRYGRGPRAVDALRGVSLSVSPGEIYGLLGRNGAGKTTLVKILLDIVKPSSGSTRILGQPSRSPSCRRAVGYLPEDHRFPEYRTGEGALHFYGMLSGVPAPARRARVPEALRLAGLTDAARRKVRGYSKGMKQRLAMAQAMLHDPQVLFLDEPTDGVDPVGRAEIRDTLLRLKGEGRTIFLNSHMLSEVERVCDRVGILDEGRLVCEGTIDALTRTERLYTVVTTPPLDDATREALRGMAVSVEIVGDGFEVGLKEDQDIDRVVDLLRSRGLSIQSFTSKKLSLEAVFLQAVDEEKGGASRSS